MTRLSVLSRSVAGTVVLVTGAARGMGRATAYLFADEGATVAVVDMADARPVAETISAAGGTAAAWDLDVSDAAAAVAVVEQIVARFGRLDILVNNAGISIPTPVLPQRSPPGPGSHAEDSRRSGEETTRSGTEATGLETEATGSGTEATGSVAIDRWPEAWDRTLAVDLTGQANLVRACLPHLLASDAGRIVNIASTEGLGATAGMSPYTVAKHGVIGLTRSLAVELGRTTVTCNCICPGAVHTGMTEPIPDQAKERFARRRVPAGRYAEPEEVAHMTLSLCLPAASYCTGAVLAVDGGLTIQNT